MQNKSDLIVKLDNAGVNKSSKWLERGVSLEVLKGQIVTLIGPNGSGKTTTAKMVFNYKVAESTENRFYYYFSVNSMALMLYIL